MTAQQKRKRPLTETQVVVLRALANSGSKGKPLYRGQMRTAESLVDRGLAKGERMPWGGRLYEITDAGRASLASQE